MLLIPEASEAISSSLIAIIARPYLDLINVNNIATTQTVIQKTTYILERLSIPISDFPPPVIFRFKITTRIISPNPKVIMAR